MSGERNPLAATLLVGCALAATVSLMTAPDAGGAGAGARTHQLSQSNLLRHGAYQSAPVRPAKLNKSLQKLPRARNVRAGGVSRERATAPLAAAEEFTQPNPNFNGIGFSGRCCPPDPNGDVGPSNYIQVVNSAFQIFNKQGVSRRRADQHQSALDCRRAEQRLLPEQQRRSGRRLRQPRRPLAAQPVRGPERAIYAADVRVHRDLADREPCYRRLVPLPVPVHASATTTRRSASGPTATT